MATTWASDPRTTRRRGGVGAEIGTRITDLPEALLCEVLRRLGTASDVCRTATVCWSFASAVRSNLTWALQLPPGCHRLCQSNPPSSSSSSSAASSSSFYPDPTSSLSSRACYMYLFSGFPDSKCSHVHYRLERSTGALQTSVSVMGMSVAWGNNSRYWKRIPLEGSVFKEGMELLSVCWFEITGTATCSLPPGRYTCAWRLSRSRGGDYGFPDHTEATVSVEGGAFIQGYISTGEHDIARYPEWSELRVGTIEIAAAEEDGEKEDNELLSVAIKFRLFNFEGGWRYGMIVDGLVIRPVIMMAKANQTEGRNEEEERKEDDSVAEPLSDEEEEEEGGEGGRRGGQMPSFKLPIRTLQLFN
ncbi:hypothetical protein CBR_g47098 [Chara braunii]|uniref:F-box domain-containing protein n=1 Tax=Chara braunii TaxID=69332 RepID=A0A388M1P1_CHABU|nr:hypothetical protein CBR_g47098 [Chara braunii]|eukprot:GBG88399.1 hypothetical protein CBR_g47098 [Chara braunii]